MGTRGLFGKRREFIHDRSVLHIGFQYLMGMIYRGWSNLINKPMVSILLENHLVDTVDTTNNPHTGDYLLQLTSDALKKVAENTKAQVVAIVTDNASNMVNMRTKALTKALDNMVFTYGCQAHILNLLSKDLMADKGRPTVSAFIIDVLKDFRNKHALLGALVKAKLPKPPSPSDTRWCYLRDCYKYYDDHWSDMVKVAKALIPPSDPARKTLENSSINRGCQDLLANFDPISTALDKIQSEVTTLAQAVEVWVGLLQDIPRNARGYSLVVERSKQALERLFFLLANVLDPRFAGARLTPQQIDKARQFGEEEGSDVAVTLNQFLARSGPFRPRLFEQASGDPAMCWGVGKVAGFPEQLVLLALRPIGCLASTANLERNFSTMAHVYGRQRKWRREASQPFLSVPSMLFLKEFSSVTMTAIALECFHHHERIKCFFHSSCCAAACFQTSQSLLAMDTWSSEE